MYQRKTAKVIHVDETNTSTAATTTTTRSRANNVASGNSDSTARTIALTCMFGLLFFLYTHMPNTTEETIVTKLAERTIITVATVEGREAVLWDALTSIVDQHPPPRAVLVNYHRQGEEGNVKQNSSKKNNDGGPSEKLKVVVDRVNKRVAQRRHKTSEGTVVFLLPAEKCWKASAKLLGALDYLLGDQDLASFDGHPLNCREKSCIQRLVRKKKTDHHHHAEGGVVDPAALTIGDRGAGRHMKKLGLVDDDDKNEPNALSDQEPPTVEEFMKDYFIGVDVNSLILATADDDMVYSPGWLRSLLYQGEQLGCTSRARVVYGGGCAVGTKGWRIRSDFVFGVSHGFRYYVVQGNYITHPYEVGVVTGGGGVLSTLATWRKLAPDVCDLRHAPQNAAIVDDIWMNGNLAKHNISRFVVAQGGENLHKGGGRGEAEQQSSAVGASLVEAAMAHAAKHGNNERDACGGGRDDHPSTQKEQQLTKASLHQCSSTRLIQHFKGVWEEDIFYNHDTSYNDENQPPFNWWASPLYHIARWWEGW